MKKFNLILTGLLAGIIIWLLVTLILGVIYQPKYSNDMKVTVNFNNKPVEGTETVETTRQVPVTCPFSGEIKTSDVKTIVKKTQSEPSERRVVITEDAFKETMQQVAYSARQEAQNEYDKNFATLLTILTIFGIAWPIIIQMLQFKFNEKELKSFEEGIEEAKVSTEKIVDRKINEMSFATAMGQEASMILFVNAYKNTDSIEDKQQAVVGAIVSFDLNFNFKVKHREKNESIKLLKYILDFLNKIPQEIKESVKTSIRRNAKPLDAFVSGKEIKELLGKENIELYRQYRAFFIDLYPWKFNGDGEPNEN